MESLTSRLKASLRSVPLIVKVKRYIWELFNIHRARGKTNLDINSTFPLFESASIGYYDLRAQLTIESINELIPLLLSLTSNLGYRKVRTVDLSSMTVSEDILSKANQLKDLLLKYGSDKASTNNYHLLYASVFPTTAKNILEIGLGTNDSSIVSHMGNTGHPGSSLRAFRDYAPAANVYGADIDSKIMFSEERIKTFVVDQTKDESMKELKNALPDELDLVIDDGLHAPNANIRTLELGLSKIKVGGWVIIEDIGWKAAPLWELIGAILPDQYDVTLYKTKSAYLFAVQRLS